MMREKVVFGGLIILTCLQALAVGSTECSTTVIIRTCGDSPVEERKLKITTVEGDHLKGRTNVDGEFVCPVCHDQIDTFKVSGADINRVSQTTVTEETNDGIRATVTLNICNA